MRWTTTSNILDTPVQSMRSRVLLASVLLIAVGLAGCAEGQYIDPFASNQEADDDEQVDGNVTDNSTVEETFEDGNTTVDETAPPEAGETGTFIVYLHDNFTQAGEAVNVTVAYFREGVEPPQDDGNESREFDPAQGSSRYDDVNWSVLVTLGNETMALNGSQVPAELQLVITEPGAYNVSGVYAGYGEELAAETTQLVVELVEEVTGPIMNVNLPIFIGCTQCTPAFGLGGGPMASVGAYTIAAPFNQNCCITWGGAAMLAPDIVLVTIPEAARGQPFTLSSTAGDPDIFFASTCALINAQLAFTTGGGQYFGAVGSESGTVPSDATCAWIWEWEPIGPFLGSPSRVHMVVV